MASSDPAVFTIVNMNVGGHKRPVYNEARGQDDKKTVPAKERKEEILNILTEKKPTLVFVEEFEWKNNLHGGAFKDSGIPYHYFFVGNKDSGFIYDSRYIDCQRLDLQPSVRRTQEEHLSRQGKFRDFFELARLCICKIKSIGPPEFELLCVSWHGPHKSKKKESQLRSLLTFLLKVKVECGNLPLMLGGDFNLKSSVVAIVCKETSGKLKMIPPKTADSIMLWVYDSDFKVTFEVENDYVLKPKAFDHDVLVLEMKISTPAEVLKRMVSFQISQCQVKNIEGENGLEKFNITIHKPFINNIEVISVSWHGNDQITDAAKMSSLTWLLHYLFLRVNDIVPYYLYPLLTVSGFVLKDSLMREYSHSKNNTLDKWIMSNNVWFLQRYRQNNQTLEPIQFCLPPLTYPPGLVLLQHATPVEIHLEHVNCRIPYNYWLKSTWEYRVTANIKRKVLF